METDSKSTVDFTEREKELVKNSWTLMMSEAGVSNQLLFYDTFFQTSPEAKKYFYNKNNTSIDFQKLTRKFHYTMDFIIENIGNLEKISEEIEDLGSIHKKLNIDSIYYSMFNDSIIRLLDEVLEDRCTDEIKEAWTKVLDFISSLMKNAPEKEENKLQNLLSRLFGK